MKTLASLTAVLLLAACTAATPPAGTPGAPVSPIESPPPAASPAPVESPPPAAPTIAPVPPAATFPPFDTDVPQDVLEAIVDEVALLANVGLGDVGVVRAEAVTWSDPGLNCPEDDMVYAQVLTDGYWVVLDAGGSEYDFRMAEGEVPRLCPEGEGEPPLEGLPD